MENIKDIICDILHFFKEDYYHFIKSGGQSSVLQPHSILDIGPI